MDTMRGRELSGSYGSLLRRNVATMLEMITVATLHQPRHEHVSCAMGASRHVVDPNPHLDVAIGSPYQGALRSSAKGTRRALMADDTDGSRTQAA